MARAMWALVRANVRYWLRVAPIVRKQLHRWEIRASAIPDPGLAQLAAGKLAHERFNVEVAAMIATTAPARLRERAVEAIVALQVMYDYLDALLEQPVPDPLCTGLRCAQAFIDAVRVGAQPAEGYYAHYPAGPGDGGYLAEMALTVRSALAELPAAPAIAEVLPLTAARVAEAQVRIHAAPHTGSEQLERWAGQQAAGTGLQWREWLFGAMGSVVGAHALIALAADEHATRERARTLDDAYLELCVLTTALDHLVDYESDTHTGQPSYIQLYATREELTQQIALIVNRVKQRARALPNGAHHLMILSGVVAYYTSQPSAMGDFARPASELVRTQLRPVMTPTLATMYAWRLGKRLGRDNVKGARGGVRLDRERWCERSQCFHLRK